MNNKIQAMLKSMASIVDDQASVDSDIAAVKAAMSRGDYVGLDVAMARLVASMRTRRIKTRRINRIAKEELVAYLKLEHDQARAGSERRRKLVNAAAAIESVPARGGSPASLRPIVDAMAVIFSKS